MYHGIVRVARQVHSTRYVPGVGDLPYVAGVTEVTKHRYTCDHCGHEYAFLEAAAEPFYCHSAACRAVRLVSIER